MQNEDKNNEIKVSVLCLAYNHEKYIRKTLEGFVNQKTNFKFEVLIHDDASTDQTASIIKEYEKQYPNLIKPIYQTENQHSKGVKIQRTYNYPRAKGKYLAWCEGDDYWCDEEKLQKQYDALELNEKCSICVHKVQCINEDGSINSRVIPEKFYGIVNQGVLSDDNVAEAFWLKKQEYPFQTSSYFVRKEAMADLMAGTLSFIGYMTGDKVILRTALSKGHLYYIDQIMSCYRLFSCESYTSCMKTWSELEKRKSNQKRSEGELLYDKYTSGRFHKYIIRRVSNRIVSNGAYDQSLMDEFIKDTDLTKEDLIANCSIQNKMKYYLSVYMHPLYTLLRKVDVFRNRKK